MKLRFYHALMDLAELVCGYGSRPYLWAAGKAVATEHSEGE